MRSIYWFRNDLRVSDNPGLHKALEASSEVVPVFIYEDRLWEEDEWGNRKTGEFRTQFLIESVADLKEALEDLGSSLIVKKGDPATILSELANEFDASEVYANKEHTREELNVEKEVAEVVNLHLEEGHTLFHPEDLPMDLRDLPDIFTQFRKAVEKRSQVRDLIPEPEVISSPDLPKGKLPELADFGYEKPSLDPRGVLEFKGGAVAAWERIDHYFWDTKKLGVYKQTRNGLIGADYSSKISPWLANGSISPREIYHEVQRYEAEHGSNQSTYWLIFELIWRDYFRFVAMKYQDRIFYKSGIKASSPKWLTNDRIFSRWAEGRTGDSFVDANMKELTRTGWMSNRGRQNVASYLVHDMGIDWRMGASFFEKYLIDHDPCSNYGNWIYVAGVGNDPRPNRKFNTKNQAEMYDPKGKYQQIWNNELLELNL